MIVGIAGGEGKSPTCRSAAQRTWPSAAGATHPDRIGRPAKYDRNQMAGAVPPVRCKALLGGGQQKPWYEPDTLVLRLWVLTESARRKVRKLRLR